MNENIDGGTGEPEAGRGPVRTGSPVPSAPPPATRPPLRRSSSDRMIAGVAGGLAEFLGVSSLAVRTIFGLAFVVIAFQIWTLLGVAVVAYALLWIFVPRDDIGISPAGRLTRRFPRIGPAIGVLLLLAGAAAIAAQLDPWLVWPVLLVGGGIVLYRYDARRTAGREPAAEAALPEPPEPPAPSVLPDPRAPRPPRERSPLGWLGLGIALLVVGIAAMLQNLGAIELRLVTYFALALLILGVTMLIGAFFGRARWLALPAILLVPFVLAASLISVPLEGGIGNTYEYPRTSSEIHGSYHRVVGEIFLDLSALAGTEASPLVNATTGIGTITVIVPFDAHVVATGRAGTGVVQIGTQETDRIADATLSTTWEPRHGDGATITLNLETGIGDIRVLRNAPTRRQLRDLEVEGP